MTVDGRIEAQIQVPLGVSFTATNSAGTATVSIPIGSYYPSDLGTQLALDLNGYAPSGWTVALSTGPTGTLQWTINCTSAPWSIVWSASTASPLRDLLGFTGDLITEAGAVTSPKQGRALWRPDCPISLDGDPRSAPQASDLRTTTGPTGLVYAVIGNVRYRHTNVGWSHVVNSLIWEGEATLPNSSWEYFYNDTQFGLGSPWLTVASKLRVYDHTGQPLGNHGNFGAGVSNWQITGVPDIAPKMPIPQFTGLFEVRLPELTTAG